MKVCPECGTEYDDAFAFCHKCGKRLEEKNETVFCSFCGKDITGYDGFCPYCGERIPVFGGTDGAVSESGYMPDIEVSVDGSDTKPVVPERKSAVGEQGTGNREKPVNDISFRKDDRTVPSERHVSKVKKRKKENFLGDMDGPDNHDLVSVNVTEIPKSLDGIVGTLKVFFSFDNLFLFDGRANRLGFALSILFWMLVMKAVFTVILYLGFSYKASCVVPTLLCMYPVYCALSRRLHDLGRNGVYAVAFLMAMLCQSLFNSFFVFVVLFVVFILPFLYLLLKEGDVGPNRYGRDPLEGSGRDNEDLS